MEKVQDCDFRTNAKTIRNNAKNETPTPVLTRPVEMLAARLVSGVSLAEAQKDRGCAPSTANLGLGGVVQTPCGRGRFAAALAAAGVTTEFLAARIKEGCDATKPVVGRDETGSPVIVAEVPDHRTRLPYLELAGKATGDLAADLDPGAGSESYELRVLRYRRSAPAE